MIPRLCKYLQSLIVATIIISYLRRSRGPKGALESHFYQRLEKTGYSQTKSVSSGHKVVVNCKLSAFGRKDIGLWGWALTAPLFP